MLQDLSNNQISVEYLIPKTLILINAPSSESNETVPFKVQPQFRLYDYANRWVENVGTKLLPWQITASLVKGFGDPNAQLIGNTTVSFDNGTVVFSDLAITHSGSGYRILYKVTYPVNLSFSIEHGSHLIRERILGARFIANMNASAVSLPFPVQPAVFIFDKYTGEELKSLSWKGQQWIIKASIATSQYPTSQYPNNTIIGTADITNGSRAFKFLNISKSGSNYKLKLSIAVFPNSSYVFDDFVTNSFNVLERNFSYNVKTSPANCNDTVVCGQQPQVEVWTVVPPGPSEYVKWDSVWYVEAYLCRNSNTLQGTVRREVPSNGVVQYTDLKFQNNETNVKLCFRFLKDSNNTLQYSNVTKDSGVFVVAKRLFYLKLSNQLTDVTETVPFKQLPLVVVMDVGTGYQYF